MPDCAIFAYTGWEPKAVYEHLSWLMSPNVLRRDIRADLVAGAQGNRWASIPAFTCNVTPAGTAIPVLGGDEDGETIVVGTRVLSTERVGVGGMIRRQCTGDYKIVPIRRKVRELAGLTRRRSPKSPVIEQRIGSSTRLFA